MYAGNEPAMKKNKTVLNGLPGELYTIEGNGKIPNNCKYSLVTIQDAQNQKQSNTGAQRSCLK